MVTISWPEACMGCGTDLDELKEYTYTKKKRERNKIKEIDVVAFLCPSCEEHVVKRFNQIGIGLVVSMILSFILGVLTITDDSLSGLGAFFILSGLFLIFIVIAWYSMEGKYVNLLHKIHIHGNSIEVHFKNPQYREIFKMANPDIPIR